ncbi:MAG: Na/Pi cotransporter family protein [Saccharofermentanales bacterium]|jgi:phosphate:Na+ symporter
MDIFTIATLLGGLALLIYGMNEMSESLIRSSGSRIKDLLERMTSNPLKAVLLGAGVTAIIQSSSATTVMIVGLVNAGLMELSQTVGLIMGANIGTTVTAWILSLGTIGTTGTFLQLFKPTFFAPLLAFFAVGILMFVKDERKRNISQVLIGFAILMFGMHTMSNAVIPLSESQEFREMFVAFSNPFLGVLVGAVLTAIIQSSSASIGILQAFTLTGAITYGSAIPIIMGQNIGTCATALISSINTSKDARRAALIHLFFNVFGTITFMVLFYGIHAIHPFTFLESAPHPINIAILNTVYKVAMTFLFLPFRDGFVRLAIKVTPDRKKHKATASVEKADNGSVQQTFAPLDARFLETPGFAVMQCHKLAIDMAGLVELNFDEALDLMRAFDSEKYQHCLKLEDLVDKYEDHLGTYMVRITARQLTDRDNRLLTLLMQSIGDFERISDHSLSIANSAKELHDKNVSFSDEALAELDVLQRAVNATLDATIQSFETLDLDVAKHIEPLEEVVDILNDELQTRHVRRLQDGRCTLELGFILTDVLTSMERIADHCSNIAVSMLELSHESLDQHAYLQNMKEQDSFNTMVDKYLKDYQLPDVLSTEYATQMTLDEAMSSNPQP